MKSIIFVKFYTYSMTLVSNVFIYNNITLHQMTLAIYRHQLSEFNFKPYDSISLDVDQ